MGKRQRSDKVVVEPQDQDQEVNPQDKKKKKGNGKEVKSHAQRRIEKEAREAKRKAEIEKRKQDKKAKGKEALDAFQKRLENYRFCCDVLGMDDIPEPKLSDHKPKRIRPTVRIL